MGRFRWRRGKPERWVVGSCGGYFSPYGPHPDPLPSGREREQRLDAYRYLQTNRTLYSVQWLRDRDSAGCALYRPSTHNQVNHLFRDDDDFLDGFAVDELLNFL